MACASILALAAAIFAAVFATLLLSGCGYNDLQRQDEQVKSAWSEVVNQYQRRADLVPNLVATVKGYAAQEQQVLTEVDQRASQRRQHQGDAGTAQRSGGVRQVPGGAGPAASPRCRGCCVVAENYPQLKSDALFRDLSSQLEGTENRITVARNRFIKAVQDFNTTVRSFPDQPDRDAVQDGSEAELHRRQRKGDQRAADGRFRQAACATCAGPAPAPKS